MSPRLCNLDEYKVEFIILRKRHSNPIFQQALDLAQKSGNIDDENLGLQVLTLAVLVILLTAPLGELAVIMAGPRLLSKPLQVMQEDIIVGRMSNQDQQNVCN